MITQQQAVTHQCNQAHNADVKADILQGIHQVLRIRPGDGE